MDETSPPPQETRNPPGWPPEAKAVLLGAVITGAFVVAAVILTHILRPQADLEPKLGNTSLALSTTPNWDSEADSRFFQEATQIFDVPLQLRIALTDPSQVRYLWLVTHNTNPEPSSCLAEVAVTGPQMKLRGRLISPAQGDLSGLFQQVFPNANINLLVSEPHLAILQLDGPLFSEEPLPGPTYLIFYLSPVVMRDRICGQGPWAVPLAAFHYPAESALLDYEFLTLHLGLEEATIWWKGSATLTPEKSELRAYVTEASTFLPHPAPLE